MAVAKYNHTLKKQICPASHQMSNVRFPLYINDCHTATAKSKSPLIQKMLKKNIQTIGKYIVRMSMYMCTHLHTYTMTIIRVWKEFKSHKMLYKTATCFILEEIGTGSVIALLFGFTLMQVWVAKRKDKIRRVSSIASF